MHRCNRRSGFTLIELVMVMSITAILATIAIVRLAPSMERARVRKSATTIAADLQYAQMIAARQRRPVVIIASVPLKSYIIRDAPSGGTIFRETHMGYDTEFAIDVLDANPSILEIFPNGVVRSEGNFTVTVNDLSRNVKISRAGQVRITNEP